MADRISKAFATSGDKTAIPENSTSTEVSFDEGWTSAYELEVGVVAGARDIDRGQHNQLFNIITANIKEWQEQGSPAYQSGVSYPEGAITRYTDGEYYICHTTQAAGTLPTNHSAFINAKFYGSYSYAVSQLAGGDSSLVGFIYTGLTVDSYDYLIYPGDGRIYSVGGVTGTITSAFDPDDGSDSGLSGNLTNIVAVTPSELNSVEDQLIGVNQVWNSPSRSLGVTYTNNTGRTIAVCLTVAATSSQDSVVLRVNGGDLAIITTTITAYNIGFGFVLVPPEATYGSFVSVGNPSIVQWTELS